MVELAPHGRPSTALRQPSSKTALVSEYLENAVFRAQLEARIPLGRIGQPSDILGPVTLFVSPAANFVTGPGAVRRRRKYGQPMKHLIACGAEKVESEIVLRRVLIGLVCRGGVSR